MDDARILPYGLGALHAALVLWLAVALLHAFDATRALANLGTVPGALLGVWFAALSWGATTWALKGQRLAPGRERDLLGRAGMAGFGAGALFVPGVVLGAMVMTRTFEPMAFILPVFAAPFAGAVGSLLAVLLAALDVGLFAAARAFAARVGSPT